MIKPLILINFKTYAESSGSKAWGLARKIASVKKEGYEIAVAPSLLTLKEIAAEVSLAVFSQHADPVLAGAHTGSISIDELSSIGVQGVLLNHSERKVSFPILQETIELCKKKKIRTIVCASSLTEVKKIASLQPEYIAYEPPELIGGDISVTKAKPDIIVNAVETVKAINPRIKVLCGAGIQSKEDVGQALVLGTQGVLISHVVAKAKDPKKVLEGLLV